MESTRRQIYLPLSDNAHCSNVTCKNANVEPSTEERYKLCSACGEKAYCSSECQADDWKAHKRACGTTNRIELGSFYPLLAYFIRLGRSQAPPHPALTHDIVNSPNPTDFSEVFNFPGGRSAKLIRLGAPMALSYCGTERWWPTATSDFVRRTLHNRLVDDGNLLLLLLAVCIPLASEMYSTTAIPKGDKTRLEYTQHRRVRLTSGSAPIADFGIVKGSTDVHPCYQMAFYKALDESLVMGQDPEDHYWIYFTTVTGEEIFLDCGLFTFDNGFLVDTDPCANIPEVMPQLGFLPAVFVDRESKREDPLMWQPTSHTERQRFSVLRDPDLIEALSYQDPALHWPQEKSLHRFMEKIAGRTSTTEEKTVFRACLTNNSRFLRLHLHRQTFLDWPERPLTCVNLDPDSEEAQCEPPPQQWEKISKHMTNVNNKYRKGKLSFEEVKSEYHKMATRAKTSRG